MEHCGGAVEGKREAKGGEEGRVPAWANQAEEAGNRCTYTRVTPPKMKIRQIALVTLAVATSAFTSPSQHTSSMRTDATPLVSPLDANAAAVDEVPPLKRNPPRKVSTSDALVIPSHARPDTQPP